MTKNKNTNTIAAAPAARAEATAQVRTIASDAYAAALAELSDAEQSRDTARRDVASVEASHRTEAADAAARMEARKAK